MDDMEYMYAALWSIDGKLGQRLHSEMTICHAVIEVWRDGVHMCGRTTQRGVDLV